MILSKEDLFYDNVEKTSTDSVTGDVLDFGQHGDDVLGNLYWFVHSNGAATITATWKTSADAAFTSPVTLATKTVGVTGPGYAVRNEPLPKGLLRYNRLLVTVSAACKITAGLTDGRDEGTPYTGE